MGLQAVIEEMANDRQDNRLQQWQARMQSLLLDVDECISASFCSLSLSSSCSIFANLSRNLYPDYFLWVGPVISMLCEANQ